MKILASILIGLVLLSGCSKPPKDVKYETMKLDWFNDAAIVPNHCLVITTKTGAATKVEAIDVATIDQAAEILGQYGWKFVSSETDGYSKIYHMQRQSPGDGKKFDLCGFSAAEINK